MSDLCQKAIAAALSFDWNNAILYNETILSENEEDINTLNRLAYAYTQIGKIDKAKKIYRKILSLDRYNFIAQKNLDKISLIPKVKRISRHAFKNTSLSPTMFIEEPGKTKTVSLINVAPLSVISKLHIGDTVQLRAKKHSIEIRDQDNNYLGAVPDDIAFRLLRFLKAGNTYLINIKNIQKNCLTVFIRELSRGKRFFSQPTFSTCASEHVTMKELKKSEESGVEGEPENQEEPEE